MARDESAHTPERDASTLERREYVKLVGLAVTGLGAVGGASAPAAGAETGYGEGGFGDGGYGGTSTDTNPAVSTNGSTGVTASEATLLGELLDLGGAASADVAFEYRQSGASTWSATAAQTRSATGTYDAPVTGLSAGTGYEFRAVADASDGDAVAGGTLSFTTQSADTNVAVSSGSASNVSETGATLSGTLEDLGGASDAACGFEYREAGASTWTATDTQTLSATGPFNEAVTGLASGTDYEFRAVTDASDGDADAGNAVAFTTAAGDTAPAVDRYAVTEAGSPNPHAELTVEWTVSDADGDLASVAVEVLDAGGAAVDSSQTTAGGASASGTDTFKLKHVKGQTFQVTLTVVDASGNSASDSRTVSE